MTRGTTYIVTNKKVVSTNEYNGDMSPEGKGDMMLTELREVKNQKDLKALQTRWNEKFGYEDTSDFRFYHPIPTKRSLVADIRWILKNKHNISSIPERVKTALTMMQNWSQGIIDFNVDYFSYWFSDWIFIKNLSGKDITIIPKHDENEKGKKITVHHGETFRLNYGHIPEDERLIEYTIEEARKHNELMEVTA